MVKLLLFTLVHLCIGKVLSSSVLNEKQELVNRFDEQNTQSNLNLREYLGETVQTSTSQSIYEQQTENMEARTDDADNERILNEARTTQSSSDTERLEKEKFEEYTRCMKTVFFRGEVTGLSDHCGIPGLPGIPGIPGQHGHKGEPGDNCMHAITQEPSLPNIHQCAWNQYNFALSIGKVQSCSFSKRKHSSAIKVEWHGSSRITCEINSACCNRWSFRIDGAECSDPQPIDGLIYLDSGNVSLNVHRAMSVVGICFGISEGIHDIALWIGNCEGNYKRGRTRTGWNSSSRIIIQELY